MGGETQPLKFVYKASLFILVHSSTCHKSTTQDCYRLLSPLKNHRPWPSLNLQTMGVVASPQPLDHQGQFTFKSSELCLLKVWQIRWHDHGTPCGRKTLDTKIPSILWTVYDANSKSLVIRYAGKHSNCMTRKYTIFGVSVWQQRKDNKYVLVPVSPWNNSERLWKDDKGGHVCPQELYLRILAGQVIRFLPLNLPLEEEVTLYLRLPYRWVNTVAG